MATASSLLVLLVFTFSSLISVQQIVAQSPTEGFPRGTEVSGKANYTVSFVPLISVIANWFPRLLTRFNPQVQQARSQHSEIGVDSNNAETACAQLQSYEFRWPDPENRQQYLYCYPDPVCQFLSQKTGQTSSGSKCHSLRTEKCPPNTEFHFSEQRCS